MNWMGSTAFCRPLENRHAWSPHLLIKTSTTLSVSTRWLNHRRLRSILERLSSSWQTRKSYPLLCQIISGKPSSTVLRFSQHNKVAKAKMIPVCCTYLSCPSKGIKMTLAVITSLSLAQRSRKFRGVEHVVRSMSLSLSIARMKTHAR